MEEDRFPAVDEPLVLALEALWPNVHPGLNVTDRELGQTYGAIQLIAFLRSKMEEQKQTHVLNRS